MSMPSSEIAAEKNYDQYGRPLEIWALQYRATKGLVPPHYEDGTANFIAWPTQRQAEMGLDWMIAEVNWQEIAEHYIADVDKAAEEETEEA